MLKIRMVITNLELTQATIEIFCGFICLMLAVIILMNGHERNSWRLLKWMFYFDDANYYHRNTGWYVYTIINGVCILTAGVMCIRYRRSVKKTMFAALLLYAIADFKGERMY